MLVSSGWPGFPMMLVRKDGSFEEVTHPRYLKPLSERQELLSRGVVLFPGEDICTVLTKTGPLIFRQLKLSDVLCVCLDGDSRDPGEG